MKINYLMRVLFYVLKYILFESKVRRCLTDKSVHHHLAH